MNKSLSYSIAYLCILSIISISPLTTLAFGINPNQVTLILQALLIILIMIRKVGLGNVTIILSSAYLVITILVIAYIPLSGLTVQVRILFFIVSILTLCFTIRDVFLRSIGKYNVDLRVVQLGLLTVVFAVLHSLYWQALTVKLLVYVAFSYVIVISMFREDFIRITHILTRIHIYMLLLCFPGFLYALWGGEAIFFIENADSRQNGFYLSTFSNTYLFGLIRPSGIYDEPGALSFIVCSTVTLREIFSLNRRESWWLLGLGCITLSMIHIIFVAIYFVVSLRGDLWGTVKISIVVSIFLTTAYFLLEPIRKGLTSLAGRFVIVDGTLSGDNRSELFWNAYDYLSASVAIFGLDKNCILNNPICYPGLYNQYGENPLTLITHLGLLLSWPYYFLLMFLLVLSLKYRSLIIFGFILLIFQRPYVLTYGYAGLIMIVSVVAYRYLGSRKNA